MNMREDIRNVMLAHGSPMRQVEVARALPQYDLRKVTFAIHGMFNEGVLSRVIREDGFRGYYASRNVKLARYATEEERVAARRERDVIRSRRRRGGGSLEELRARQAEARKTKGSERRLPPSKAGRRPLAEYRAEQAANREANREAKHAKHLEAQRRYRARKQQERKPAAPKPSKKPMSVAQRVFTQTPAAMKAWPGLTLAPPPAKPRAETVEEFKARGGQIERVPAGWEREQLAA